MIQYIPLCINFPLHRVGAKWRIDLHERLKHNSRMHFDSLSL
ncbi:hypothetical protein HMPREF1582_01269, partial [Gardnerella vaginalis JCP8151A]